MSSSNSNNSTLTTALQYTEHAICIGALYYTYKQLSSGDGLVANISNLAVKAVSAVPGGAAIVEGEKKKVLDKIEEFVMHGIEDDNKIYSIPEAGTNADDLLTTLKQWRDKESDYMEGKAFGGVYSDDKEHKRLIGEASLLYMDSNALYPQIFPGLRKFEAEIVSMTVNMLNGDDKCCGAMTSGGSESILIAVKAYRERARKIYGKDHKANMVIPQSAHAAFVKAAYYFGIELRNIPVGADYKADVNAMKAAMDQNTILIVGSAPNFPHGTIDNIVELAKLVRGHKTCGLHVDGCLGGFLLPWLNKLQLIQDKWNYEIPEVTSISADIHKFGYGPKGTSVITYRNTELRRCQYFAYANWSGGLYCSPAIQGSRGGAQIAGAWASIVHLGQEGYLKAAQHHHDTFSKIREGIKQINGIELVGEPKACAIAFKEAEGSNINILHVADVLSKSNWGVNRLQKPICVQFQVGHRINFDADKFLSDLQEAVNEVKNSPNFDDSEGLAPIYGMAATLPNRGLVNEILEGYMDALLKV